jgi:hypothetical protein
VLFADRGRVVRQPAGHRRRRLQNWPAGIVLFVAMVLGLYRTTQRSADDRT